MRKKEKNLNPYFTLHTKNNSRWSIDLNMKSRTCRALGENTRDYLCDLEWAKIS